MSFFFSSLLLISLASFWYTKTILSFSYSLCWSLSFNALTYASFSNIIICNCSCLDRNNPFSTFKLSMRYLWTCFSSFRDLYCVVSLFNSSCCLLHIYSAWNNFSFRRSISSIFLSLNRGLLPSQAAGDFEGYFLSLPTCRPSDISEIFSSVMLLICLFSASSLAILSIRFTMLISDFVSAKWLLYGRLSKSVYLLWIATLLTSSLPNWNLSMSFCIF